MGYDQPMKRLSSTATAALLLAASLAACSAPKAAPAPLKVTSVSTPDAKTLASQLCADMRKMSDDEAVQRMAVRASESKVSAADQDAIVDYAGKVTCPEQF
jgi:hypothetical protein